MKIKTIHDYYADVKGRVARSGYSDDWNSVRLEPSDRTQGVVQACPLRFRDGSLLNFYEMVVIHKDSTIIRPVYSYHFERSGYFFRYDRDPVHKKAVVHEECHLHANQNEPRFKTHAAAFDEVFDFIVEFFFVNMVCTDRI